MMNVRQMLLGAGVPSFLADMAIPFMWFMAGTTDPDSPSTIEIVRGAQRSLRALGYRVHVSGVLDRSTSMALARISGRNWLSKTWVQIYQDLETARRDPARTGRRDLALAGFGEYYDTRGLTGGPFPSSNIGTPPGPLGMGATDAQLSFGRGIRDKNAMVPIPRWSGVTYSTFARVQRAVNRLLSVPGSVSGEALGGRIDEDGILGEETFRGFKKVQDGHFSYPGKFLMQLITNSAGLAAQATLLASVLEQKADALGVPAGANRGSVSIQAREEQTSGPLTQAETAAIASSESAGAAVKRYLPFLAAAGAVAYFVTKKRKKGKK